MYQPNINQFFNSPSKNLWPWGLAWVWDRSSIEAKRYRKIEFWYIDDFKLKTGGDLRVAWGLGCSSMTYKMVFHGQQTSWVWSQGREEHTDEETITTSPWCWSPCCYEHRSSEGSWISRFFLFEPHLLDGRTGNQRQQPDHTCHLLPWHPPRDSFSNPSIFKCISRQALVTLDPSILYVT